MEGAELDGLPQWVSRGTLENVEQLGIELHTAPNFNGILVPPERFKILLETLQNLLKKGLKVISYEINGTAAKYGTFFLSIFCNQSELNAMVVLFLYL